MRADLQNYQWEPTPQVLGANLSALDQVDELTPGQRACVHEFGYPVVIEFLNAGVTEPRHIRALVNRVWLGTRSRLDEPRKKTIDNIASNHLDALLIEAGAGLPAAALVRFLWVRGYVLVPRDPSPGMVQASMATVSGHDVRVTKETKHKMRLTAAIAAAARNLWPGLTAE